MHLSDRLSWLNRFEPLPSIYCYPQTQPATAVTNEYQAPGTSIAAVPRFDMFPVTQQCVSLEFESHDLSFLTAFRSEAARKPNSNRISSSAFDRVRAPRLNPNPT